MMRALLCAALAVSSGLTAAVGQAQGVSFITSRDFGAGSAHSFSVAVGDFNGDGWLDLAVPNYSSGNILVLWATAMGASRRR